MSCWVKMKEIFSNPNLEIRFCVFDILIAEFEKEEKDEKNRNLVDNFINNNLNNIIVELGKFSDDKDDVSLLIRYFNFYLSNLKIKFYAFKSIMGKNDIIEEIDKFETLEDDNRKNFFKITQVELNDDKINFIKKLYLEYLTNIIGKNLIIINDKSNYIYKVNSDIEEAKRDILKKLNLKMLNENKNENVNENFNEALWNIRNNKKSERKRFG